MLGIVLLNITGKQTKYVWTKPTTCDLTDRLFVLEAQMGIRAWKRIFPISFTSLNIKLEYWFVGNVSVDFFSSEACWK